MPQTACYTRRTTGDMNCEACQKSEVETILHKCPTCFKWICADCGRRDYGRIFCSKRCADEFFFGDDDAE